MLFDLLFLWLWMLLCTPETIWCCFSSRALLCANFTTFSPIQSALPPSRLWLNVSLASPGPYILSPSPPCQSSKKLRVIHKDRLLFKALPSKGTSTITRKTLITIYKSLIYNSNTPSYLILSAWLIIGTHLNLRNGWVKEQRGSESLSDLPKVTQWIKGRIGEQDTGFLIPHPKLPLLPPSHKPETQIVTRRISTGGETGLPNSPEFIPWKQFLLQFNPT